MGFITVRAYDQDKRRPVQTKLISVQDDQPLAQQLHSFVTGHRLVLEEVVTCVGLEALDAESGIDIDLDNWARLRVPDLEGLGKYVLLKCRAAEPAPAPAPALGGAFGHMMQRQKAVQATETAAAAEVHLPSKKNDTRYDFVVYDALLQRLIDGDLGVPEAKVNSLHMVLVAIADALCYLLPFDDARDDLGFAPVSTRVVRVLLLIPCSGPLAHEREPFLRGGPC